MAIIHADTGDGFKRTVQASISRVTDHDQWSVTMQTEGISDSDIVICAGEGIVRYRIALSIEEIVQLALFLPKNRLGALSDLAAHRANVAGNQDLAMLRALVAPTTFGSESEL